MAHRVHAIGTYDYSIDAGLGEPCRLRLWTPDGRPLAQLGFVADGAALPPPRIAPDLSTATAFLRTDALPALLDMMRNEGRVFVRFEDRPPGYVLVHTRKSRAIKKGERK